MNREDESLEITTLAIQPPTGDLGSPEVMGNEADAGTTLPALGRISRKAKLAWGDPEKHAHVRVWTAMGFAYSAAGRVSARRNPVSG